MENYTPKFLMIEKNDLDKRHFREVEKFIKRIHAIENEIKSLSADLITSRLSRERRQQIQKINASLHEELITLEKLRKNLDSI